MIQMDAIEEVVLTDQLKELLVITKKLSSHNEHNPASYKEDMTTLSELTLGNIKSAQMLADQISRINIPKNIELTNRTIVKLDNVSITFALIFGMMLFTTLFFHWQLKNEVAVANELVEFSKQQKMPKALELVAVPQVSVYDYLITKKDNLKQLEY